MDSCLARVPGALSQVKMSLDDYRDVMIDLVEYGVGMTTT